MVLWPTKRVYIPFKTHTDKAKTNDYHLPLLWKLVKNAKVQELQKDQNAGNTLNTEFFNIAPFCVATF